MTLTVFGQDASGNMPAGRDYWSDCPWEIVGKGLKFRPGSRVGGTVGQTFLSAGRGAVKKVGRCTGRQEGLPGAGPSRRSADALADRKVCPTAPPALPGF